LWNPYLFAGAPFLAAGQHSALYPFSLIYYALPLERAYGWFTVVQLGLAGVFMFVLMRTFGLRRPSAVFAGVAYQLSGFLVVSVVFQMVIASAAWLPLILAMCERVIRQSNALGNRPSSMPWVVIGAFAIAMVVLAGHIEMLAYTLIVAAFFCVWRISTVIGFRHLRVDGMYLAARVAWLLVMAAGGILLGAIQLVPLLELVTRNFREGSSTFGQVLSYAFPVRYITQWLAPNLYGNPAHHTYFDLFTLSTQPVTTPNGNTAWGVKNYVEGAAYVGIITLVFAGVAIVNAVVNTIRELRHRNVPGSKRRANAPTWFFIVLGVASVLFIFGTPAYAILYYGLPGFSQLHSPFRWVFPLTLCLAALASIGFDALLGEAKPHRIPAPVGMRRPPAAPVKTQAGTTRGLTLFSYAGIAVGVLIILGVIVVRLLWPSFQPLFARALQNPLPQQAFASPEMFFSYEARFVVRFALLLIASCAVLWMLARRRSTDSAQADSSWISHLAAFSPLIAIGLLAVDLNLAWAGFNPSVDPKLLTYTPTAIQQVQQDKTLWRLTGYEPEAGKSVKPLNANAAWPFKLQDIRGYDSIIPKQYADYMKAIEPQGELLYNRIAPIKNPRSLESPLLDLLGTKYIITEDEIDAPGFESIYDDGGARIYQNERAMPRAFTLPISSTVVVTDLAQAIQRYDPRKFVILSGVCPATANCANPIESSHKPANITSYKNNEVWVDVQIDEPSWLILADSYFPGWRAFVRPLGGSDAEEREAPIALVNGNFRGVRIEIGDWRLGMDSISNLQSPIAFTIRFKYSPDSFRLGVFASFIAFVALLFLGGVYVWRNAAREGGMLSPVRRVAKNSLILTGLNIVARLINFVFAILMLRLLGPEGAGNYYFAVVIVGWFEILMNFGLNTFLTREISRDPAHARTYLLTTSRLRMLLALAVVPLVLLFILIWQGAFGLAASAAIAIVLLTISQFPSSLATGLSALFFAAEKAEVPAALTIVSALLTVSIGTAFLLFGWGVIGLALTSIIVNVITLGILYVAARRLMRTLPAPGGAPPLIATNNRAMMRESAPLMFNHLLATLFFKIDIPLLEAIQSPTVVGWYSAAYKYIDAFNIIPAFFTQSLFPALSRMAVQRDQSLSRSYTLALKLMVMVALPLAVATTFLSQLMIGILGGPEFLPAGAIALAIMAWSMPVGWINSVTNYALIAVNQQRALTRAFVIGLVFNIAANLILIPTFSYAGAAVVTILSEIVEGAAFYFYVRRHIAPVSWVEVLARPALAAGAMALVTFLFASAGLLLIGLMAGLAVYAAILWLTGALSAGEREILRPLVRRRA
jgi:O-antigen/teichoic acid export membrane protein